MDDTGSSTGEADRRRERATALRALARRTGRRPAVEEAVRVFGGERQLLLAVHHQWQVNLLARLDSVLEDGGDDVHAAVLRAVEEQSRVLPGFAALLREHDDDPLLSAARRRLSAYVDQACPCGRRHPLVADAVPARAPARCLVRRVSASAVRWGRRLGLCTGSPVLRLPGPVTPA